MHVRERNVCRLRPDPQRAERQRCTRKKEPAARAHREEGVIGSFIARIMPETRIGCA